MSDYSIDYSVTPADLIAALQKLPPGSRVMVNAVKNLAVLNEKRVYVGFISLRGGGPLVIDLEDA